MTPRTQDQIVGGGKVKAPTDSDSSDRELVMQFESLGGTGHGCEFGIFQRQFGAEPLSLLRWSDLDHVLLTRALENRFVGVGNEEFTTVFEPAQGSHGEWWTRDSRYHMAMRSFVKVSDIPYEKMVVLVRRRLNFLREKLLADLQDGQKIFVYRNMFRNLTKQELDRLHKSVRSYGDNTLLYIQYEDDVYRNGSVIANEDGLLIGFIDHFRFSPNNTLIGDATKSLLAICRAAIAVKKNLVASLSNNAARSADAER